MTVDPATGGYWLVATDGGIFAYNAPFLGSTGSITLNKPVVGMASASNGSGYWLVATDGGIFAYGVPFWGSTGSIHLNKPVVGMAADAGSSGYWLVASDGGIFAYNAPFYGSTGSLVLSQPIVGMEANATASGYRFVAADGGIFAYGSSQFYGTPAFAPPPAPPTPAPAQPSAPAGGGSARLVHRRSVELFAFRRDHGDGYDHLEPTERRSHPDEALQDGHKHRLGDNRRQRQRLHRLQRLFSDRRLHRHCECRSWCSKL